MIFLTIDARLNRGIPKAIGAIVLFAFLLHTVTVFFVLMGIISDAPNDQWMVFRYDQPNPLRWFFSLFASKDYLSWVVGMSLVWIFGSLLEDRLGFWKVIGLFVIFGMLSLGLHWCFAFLFLQFQGSAEDVFQAPAMGPTGAIAGFMGLLMLKFYGSKIWISLGVLKRGRFLNLVPIPLWCIGLAWLVADGTGLLRDMFGGDGADYAAHLVVFVLAAHFSAFLGFRSLGELYMERGQEFLDGKMFDKAAVEFEKALKLKGHSPLLHEKLGLCYWGLRDPQVSGDMYAEKSRWHFVQALEIYTKEVNLDDALDLYEKVIKTFAEEHLPRKIALLLHAYQNQPGRSRAAISSNREEQASILEKNFMDQNIQGLYPEAYETLHQLLETMEIEQMGPDLLEAAGDVCSRAKDQPKTEEFFTRLSKKGNERQTVRALTALARGWIQTPRQTRLPELYQKARERLIDLDLYPEWIELGEKLNLRGKDRS